MSGKVNANMHASGIVNMSLDLESRQMVLTIDNVIIPATDVFLERFVSDGEQFISFSYTLESTTPNGMKERRQFFLPRPEDTSFASRGELNEFGFASKILYDDEKAKADVIDFLSKKKKSP